MSSKITIKGTTTIPSKVRKDMQLSANSRVDFVKNEITGEYTIRRALDINEIRKRNTKYIKEHRLIHPSDKTIKKLIGEGMAEEAVQRYKRS